MSRPSSGGCPSSVRCNQASRRAPVAVTGADWMVAGAAVGRGDWRLVAPPPPALRALASAPPVLLPPPDASRSWKASPTRCRSTSAVALDTRRHRRSRVCGGSWAARCSRVSRSDCTICSAVRRAATVRLSPGCTGIARGPRSMEARSSSTIRPCSAPPKMAA